MTKKNKFISGFLFMVTLLLTLFLVACGSKKPFGKESYKVDYEGDLCSIAFYDFEYVEEDGIVYEVPTLVDSLLLNYGTELKWLPTLPDKDNKKFAGWYLDETLATYMYHKVVPESEAISCYARYEIPNDTIYVSSEGSVYNSGTSRSRPLTIEAACKSYKAGATIYIEEGTYNLNKTLAFSAQGDSNNITKIIGSTEGEGVVFNYKMNEDDKNVGIKVCGDYHQFYNITVKSAGDNGMLLGSSNNIIENCVFTENKDTGLQIARYNGTIQSKISQYPSNNYIKNCTSFNNYDSEGENADGFACKLTTGHNNVFDGCIAYWNVDDGWDLYAKPDSGNIGLVKILNCVSFANGRRLNASKTGVDENFSGDGNGFKLGGSSIPGQVIVENCIAAYNYAHGFTDNSNPGVISIKNCTSLNNGQFGATEGTNAKQYDNFNINRDTVKENRNFYEGLFSFYDNSGKQKNPAYRSDEFNGSLANSILYYDSEAYIVDGSLSICSEFGFVDSKQVSSYTYEDTDCNTTTPQSLISTFGTSNFHKSFRNEDNSLNLKTLWKINSNVLNDIQVGANLHLESDTYYHPTFKAIGTNETADQRVAREVYDQIDLAVNAGYIFNDIYLPISYYDNVTVTWSSSDKNIVNVSNDYITNNGTIVYTYGIVNSKPSEDLTCTLTATIKVGGVTLKKSFDVTLQKFEARLGEITGIKDETLLDTATLPDIYDYDIKDYTSTSLSLVKGEEFSETIEILYQEDYGAATQKVNALSATPGIYTINYSFGCEGYSPTQLTRVITIVDNTSTYRVLNSNTGLGYIIDNVITFNSTTEYYKGELYTVAVEKGIVPTAQEILDAYNGTVPQTFHSNVHKQDISSLTQSAQIELNTNYVEQTSIDLYAFIKNENGNGELYYAGEVLPTEIIKYYSQLKDALTISDNSGKAYKLDNDIDCENDTWTQTKGSYTFKGYFDGGYYTIKNLKIMVDSNEGGGMFFTTKDAIIKNLKLEEVHTRCTNPKGNETAKTGVLVGDSQGSLTINNINLYNCSAVSFQRTGGIVGQVSGNKNDSNGSVTTISNVVINTTKINNNDYAIGSYYTTTDSSGSEIRVGGKYVGGIVAHVEFSQPNNHITVSNCVVSTKLLSYNQFAAGIVGRAKLKYDTCSLLIDNCMFTGVVNSESDYAAGIIAGRDSGFIEVKNCTSIGQLTASKGAGPIISSNLCNNKGTSALPIYEIKPEAVSLENCHYALDKYDEEIHGSTYDTEEKYIQELTKNDDWKGDYLYADEYNKIETWLGFGHDFTNTFDFLYSNYTIQITLKCFNK